MFDVHLMILHAPNCRTLKESRNVCCRVLGFHRLITSQDSTHTPQCSTLTPRFFVSEFWVFCRVLSFHRLITSQNSTHTHHDAKRSPHDFSFLTFPGAIFRGPFFPGTIFFRGPFFPDTIFPRTITHIYVCEYCKTISVLKFCVIFFSVRFCTTFGEFLKIKKKIIK